MGNDFAYETDYDQPHQSVRLNFAEREALRSYSSHLFLRITTELKIIIKKKKEKK